MTDSAEDDEVLEITPRDAWALAALRAGMGDREAEPWLSRLSEAARPIGEKILRPEVEASSAVSGAAEAVVRQLDASRCEASSVLRRRAAGAGRGPHPQR